MRTCYHSDERLTAKAVADLYCVSTRTAYRLIASLRAGLGKPAPLMLTVGDFAGAYGIDSPRILPAQE